MLDHVVVDVEIQKCIDQVEGGWNATDKLGISVACVWEYSTERMKIYGPDDVEALRNRLLKADKISGYNIVNFDYPVIWSKNKRQWLDHCLQPNEWLNSLLNKTNDLLRRIWTALGNTNLEGPCGLKGTSLQEIASATLGKGKIGNGADAPKWYQAGQLYKVIDYCCDDVMLECDLTDFIDQYGYVIHLGNRLEIKK